MKRCYKRSACGVTIPHLLVLVHVVAVIVLHLQKKRKYLLYTLLPRLTLNI